MTKTLMHVTSKIKLYTIFQQEFIPAEGVTQIIATAKQQHYGKLL